jgi:3-deoxy-D-manno-octulosonate 8-phosphate phosphatase (KDO 8-P phosphatase)
MDKKTKSIIADIRLLALDVDGVLTDGNIILNHDGTESKHFNLLDGHGIRMWHRAGLKTAFISGRMTEATAHRAKQLEVTYVFQDCHEKLPAFELLLKKTGLDASQIAYIGDDVMDIPLLRRAGFGAAVASAADDVKQYAAYVTKKNGGSGAVREVIEYLLKNAGKWDELMKLYLV